MGETSGSAHYGGGREPAPGQRRRRFQPDLAATLALLAALPLFIAAGLWQWQKAETKAAAQVEREARLLALPVKLPAAPVAAEALRGRRLLVEGSFEAERQFFVDNRVYRGRAGYYLITPLRLSGSTTRVLVNRGWLPAREDRRLPEVTTPGGPMVLSGVAAVPAARYFSLGSEGSAAGWQPLWQHLDLARFSHAVPYPIQPLVLDLDAASPGGFVRDWPRPDAGIERHRAYALQWWGFAATAVGLWLYYSRR